MITTSNLSKKYKDVTVLQVEGLEIPKGQSFGLVGNNGAGKTTYFSLLLDLIQPSSGHIENNGVMVHESEDWKPFTSSFIDESFLIGYLTAEEYFYFIDSYKSYIYGVCRSFCLSVCRCRSGFSGARTRSKFL